MKLLSVNSILKLLGTQAIEKNPVKSNPIEESCVIIVIFGGDRKLESRAVEKPKDISGIFEEVFS